MFTDRYVFETTDRHSFVHCLQFTLLWYRQMKRLYKNWTVHNLLAHPLMELVYLLTLGKAERLCNWVHDITIPEHKEGAGRG